MNNTGPQPKNWIRIVPRPEGFPLRQRQIAIALCIGLTRAQVARYLGISPNAVDQHRRALFMRLRVQSTLEFVRAIQERMA